MDCKMGNGNMMDFGAEGEPSIWGWVYLSNKFNFDLPRDNEPLRQTFLTSNTYVKFVYLLEDWVTCRSNHWTRRLSEAWKHFEDCKSCVFPLFIDVLLVKNLVMSLHYRRNDVNRVFAVESAALYFPFHKKGNQILLKCCLKKIMSSTINF